MRISRGTAVGAVLALGAGALVVAGSRVPWTFDADGHAVLRLSWRAPGGRVETCRPLTAEEAASVPAHMRRPKVCEVTGLPYLLALTVDGRQWVSDTVRPAGARADRPVTVFREVPLAPGEHAIEVVFQPLAAPSDEGDEDEGEEREAGAEEEAGEPLRLTASVRLESREVALVTFDPRRRALVVREGAP